MLEQRTIVYGAFKGMGDLLAAAPVITAELNSGVNVLLLVFPQIRRFVDLLNFGPAAASLEVCELPVGGRLASLAKFFQRMSRYSPELVWISPHAPAPAASWKIPLLLWWAKKRYWPRALLVGAHSERLSVLFDERVAVDRTLPYALREWTAFGLLPNRSVAQAGPRPPLPAFKDSIQQARAQPRAYDLLIHPGATADNRKWPAQKYAELLERVPETYSIAVVGLPEDLDALKAVLPVGRDVLFLSGSLESAIKAIARARVALTMDSGTMFFANMLGVPTVALFGPSNPSSVLAPDSHVQPFFEPRFPCQPCGSPRCRQPAIYCMSSIEPAPVAERLLRLLRDPRHDG